MAATEGQKSSVQLVQDITKQVLALATGIVALSATFIEKILSGAIHDLLLLFLSWLVFTISVIAGILTLSSLVYNLKRDKYDPFATATTIPAVIQWISFILGIVLFIVFISLNINSSSNSFRHITPHKYHMTNCYK
jgi:hypothetical protein